MLLGTSVSGAGIAAGGAAATAEEWFDPIALPTMGDSRATNEHACAGQWRHEHDLSRHHRTLYVIFPRLDAPHKKFKRHPVAPTSKTRWQQLSAGLFLTGEALTVTVPDSTPSPPGSGPIVQN